MAIKVKLFGEETKGRGNISLPPGRYLFRVEHVEQDVAKTGRGQLQLRLKTVEGKVTEATFFDRWNLTTNTDKEDSYIPGFWKDATKAWPDIYDATTQVLDETKLMGRTYHGTVFEDEKSSGMLKIKNHSFVPLAGTLGAAAAPAASAVPEEAPKKFGNPS